MCVHELDRQHKLHAPSTRFKERATHHKNIDLTDTNVRRPISQKHETPYISGCARHFIHKGHTNMHHPRVLEDVAAQAVYLTYLRVRKEVRPARNSVPTEDPRREMSKNESSWSDAHVMSTIVLRWYVRSPTRLCHPRTCRLGPPERLFGT
jgi:hypothetical protein